MQNIDENKPTLNTLQTSAQTVLVGLPTCEAKEGIKKELLEIQNKYEELQWKVRNTRDMNESCDCADCELVADSVCTCFHW